MGVAPTRETPRAGGVDPRHRDLQVEVVGERFVDQRRQRRLVESRPPALEVDVIDRRRRQVDGRRCRRRRRAARDRRRDGYDQDRLA
jgi:hypothetical protein